jgi:predicted phage baseplate assembly protein
MELIGVKLAPASPATTDVTFRLSAPQPAPVVIPSGTEVATVRTETEEAIVFTTDADLKIEAPVLQYFLITRDNVNFVDFTNELGSGKPIDVFKEVPQQGNAFYLGYRQSLSGRVLTLTIDCVTARGVGVRPDDPPLVWEYWDEAAQNWKGFERKQEAYAWLERDGTSALDRKGDLVLHLPTSFAATSIGLREAYWIRCRVIAPRPNQPIYRTSPAILAVNTHCIGAMTPVSHCSRVNNEQLGISDGTPGQRFRIANSPLLPLNTEETIEVMGEEGKYEAWQAVPDFSQSQPHDKHFLCDTREGEILFGPSIRQPDGQIRQYGHIPPKGKPIRMRSYRYGGGTKGNVGRNTLTVLKSSIPFVASVTNRRAASGGTDSESLENAILRAPQVFRTRNRAVTEEDFEFLALQASPSVARARCIQSTTATSEGGQQPGVVLLLVMPWVEAAQSQIQPEQLEIPLELKQEIQSYLDERRLLTSALVISEPSYYWVTVDAKVRIKQKFDPAHVKESIEMQLYRFIHPLTGGPEGTGWPFGRDLVLSEIYAQMERVEGVEYVDEARIYLVDLNSHKPGDALQRLALPKTAVACSYEHHIVIEEAGEL